MASDPGGLGAFPSAPPCPLALHPGTGSPLIACPVTAQLHQRTLRLWTSVEYLCISDAVMSTSFADQSDLATVGTTTGTAAQI